LIIVSNMGTIVFNMSTIAFNNLLRDLLGKTRSSILALLYTHPEESFYMREIFRRASLSPGSGQRELKWLTERGLIKRKVSGYQVYYKANQGCPIFKEIREMITKTVGIGDVLRSGLASVRPNIRVALLFGSALSGKVNSDSDIDLLIVGNITFAEVVEKLSQAQEVLNREINPLVFSPSEFKRKIAKRDHFLRSLLIKGEFHYLIGDKTELKKLAEKRLAS